MCGPVSYDVTISPSDGVEMMRITNTSCNFTGLTPDNSYTVTVAGRNDAGVGESTDMIVLIAGKLVQVKYRCIWIGKVYVHVHVHGSARPISINYCNSKMIAQY